MSISRLSVPEFTTWIQLVLLRSPALSLPAKRFSGVLLSYGQESLVNSVQILFDCVVDPLPQLAVCFDAAVFPPLIELVCIDAFQDGDEPHVELLGDRVLAILVIELLKNGLFDPLAFRNVQLKLIVNL